MDEKERLAERLFEITQALTCYDELAVDSCPKSQHILRDVMNVMIGKHKYGYSANIRGKRAVKLEVFPMTNAAKTAEKVIREHAVPVIVLARILQDATCWEDCLKVIDLFTVAVLSSEEDASLNLKNKMPDGWEFHHCVFARYHGQPFINEIIATENKRRKDPISKAVV